MKTKRGIFRFVPLVPLLIAVAAVLCGILHLVAWRSVSFADWFNETVSPFFRMLLSALSGWLPFSLGEALVILVIPFGICLLILGIRCCVDSPEKTARYVSSVLAIPLMIYVLFVLTFAAGYQSTRLSEKLGLERPEKVTEVQLYMTALTVVAELNELADNVDFLYGRESLMDMDFKEMTAELNEAYRRLDEEYEFMNTFSSSPKQITLSEPMTYTHISGVYTFFTGEANVNVHYPDFVIPFTTAHEMAHQRGIAREDEANFVAFLACIVSDSPYIRYSGYLNLYEYVASALYKASPNMYHVLLQEVDSKVRGELAAYSEFFKPYRSSAASEVTDKVNDAYLSSQGTEGVVSYGLVVDLAVAYYESLSYTGKGLLP